MSRATLKRSFDCLNSTSSAPPPCSPYKIQFLDSSSNSNSSGSQALLGSQQAQFSPAQLPGLPAEPQAQQQQQQQPFQGFQFQSPQPQPQPQQQLAMSPGFQHTKRLRMLGDAQTARPDSSPFVAPPLPDTFPVDIKRDPAEKPIFTLRQVREILAKALEERDSTLRAEYDRILQEKLVEQYNNFCRFNEDYISRVLKKNDLSYVS